MKRKIFMISFGCALFLLFCTVTSFRVEELLIPEVTMVTPSLLEDFPNLQRIPAECIVVNEAGEEGVWSVKEETNIWGNKEYTVTFADHCIIEKGESGAIVQGVGEKVVMDTLRPLKAGQVVKEAKK